jgi:hypothetical protein
MKFCAIDAIVFLWGTGLMVVFYKRLLAVGMCFVVTCLHICMPISLNFPFSLQIWGLIPFFFRRRTNTDRSQWRAYISSVGSQKAENFLTSWVSVTFSNLLCTVWWISLTVRAVLSLPFTFLTQNVQISHFFCAYSVLHSIVLTTLCGKYKLRTSSLCNVSSKMSEQLENMCTPKLGSTFSLFVIFNLKYFNVLKRQICELLADIENPANTVNGYADM